MKKHVLTKCNLLNTVFKAYSNVALDEQPRLRITKENVKEYNYW